MKNSSESFEYFAELGGIPLGFSFQYADTSKYLRRFTTSSKNVADSQVSVSQQEFDDWAAAGNKIDAFAEFCLLCQQASKRLFDADRCIFHAAAIRWRGRAWLIAGGSGVGKSTQCRILLELWPDEFTIINGDKPVLECRKDGSVMVHPSPWNGKEGLGGAEAAPLAGIFFLSRGDEDAVESVSPAQAATRAFLCVFHDFESTDVIRRAGTITKNILNSCPSWSVTSCNIPDSTRLIYETMSKEAETLGL